LSVQADGPLKKMYERIKHRRGGKVAKVAVAREILTLSYYGLREAKSAVFRLRQPGRTRPWLLSPLAAGRLVD